ncbi:hypothetical protein TYRP_014158 [Tyrophagus putrescentiae]|nr:hypothetical protein TYRP_014158 [Tyrophagus putrescentiae]
MNFYIFLSIFGTLFLSTTCNGTHITVTFNTNVSFVPAGKPFSATCSICRTFIPYRRQFQVYFMRTNGTIALFDLKNDQTAHNQTFFNQPTNNEGITVVSSTTKNYLPTYEVIITVKKPNRLDKYWCELHVNKDIYSSYNTWPDTNGTQFTVGLQWAALLLSLLKLSHF